MGVQKATLNGMWRSTFGLFAGHWRLTALLHSAVYTTHSWNSKGQEDLTFKSISKDTLGPGNGPDVWSLILWNRIYAISCILCKYCAASMKKNLRNYLHFRTHSANSENSAIWCQRIWVKTRTPASVVSENALSPKIKYEPWKWQGVMY